MNKVFLNAIDQTIIENAIKEYENATDLNYEFSDCFNKKMKKLIHNQKMAYYPFIKTTARKIITIIAATLIIGSATVAAYEPLRDWFFGLFVTENEKNADVTFVSGDISVSELKTEIKTYMPTFAPDGYSIINEEKNDYDYTVTYSDNKNIIQYIQTPITANNQIDTENMTCEEIKIGENKGYVAFDNEYSSLVWNDLDYTYIISGHLSKSDIIHMASSLNMTK